jgi:hypothetical protein
VVLDQGDYYYGTQQSRCCGVDVAADQVPAGLQFQFHCEENWSNSSLDVESRRLLTTPIDADQQRPLLTIRSLARQNCAGSLTNCLFGKPPLDPPQVRPLQCARRQSTSASMQTSAPAAVSLLHPPLPLLRLLRAVNKTAAARQRTTMISIMAIRAT